MTRLIFVLTILAGGGAAAQEAVTYVCDNGQDITATYDEGVTLDLGGGAPSILSPAPAPVSSETGARYLGEGLSWTVGGEFAVLAPLTPGTEELADPGTRCFSGGTADMLRAEAAAGVASFSCELGTRVRTFEAPRDTLVLWLEEPGAALTALPTGGHGRLWGGDEVSWRLFEDGEAELTLHPVSGPNEPHALPQVEACADVSP